MFKKIRILFVDMIITYIITLNNIKHNLSFYNNLINCLHNNSLNLL